MKLTLLGTGCPSVHANRYGPSNLIHNKKTKILVDCGSGVTQRLLQAGFKGAEIDYLLITHLHSDHVIDFYQLIMSSWHQYRKKEWKIIGPKGTKKYINSIMSCWSSERKKRINYEKRYSTKGFDMNIREISKDGELKINDIRVRYFQVDHKPIKYAFGYSFIKNNNKITLSGDTRPCKNLNKNAFNSDLLLHEVFIEYAIKPKKNIRSKETINNVKKYHTSSNEVGKIAKKIKAKNLILNHFVPPSFNEKKLEKIVSKHFGKRPILGKDLMTIDIKGNIED